MNIYHDVQPVGGQGGSPFSEVGDRNGKVLEKIGVWAGGWQIKALKIKLTGNEPVTYGHPSGRYQEFAFNPGERITRLSLWTNGKGTRTGWISFDTNLGRKFDHGMTDWDKKQEFPIEVVDGICIGVQGRAGADIDKMGFVFLNPILSSVIRDVHYPTLAFDAQGIEPETIDVFSDRNTGRTPRNWRFAGQRRLSTTSSWSFTVGLEVHTKVSIEAGIPEVAKVSGEIGWKVSASTTHDRSQTDQRDLSWEESGTLNPGDSINLQALTRRGQITLPYEGMFQVVLKSGETFQFPMKGVYEGLTYTGVEITEITPAALTAFRNSSVIESAPMVVPGHEGSIAP